MGIQSAIITAFLRTLAMAVPLVAKSPSRATSYASALNYGATLIELGGAGEEKLVALTDHLKELHAAGQTVTDDDFSALKQRSDDAHAILQSSGEVPHSTAPPIDEAEPPSHDSNTGDENAQ